jgi:Domain of unknown function (DUF4440)
MDGRTNRWATMLAIAITIGLAFAPGAADAAAAGTQSATRSEILALHEQFAHAYVAADRAALDRLLDDRVVFVHGDGRSLNKAQVLSSMDRSPGTPQPRVRAIAIRLAKGYKVFLFDGKALLTGVNELTLVSTDADGSPTSRIQLDVFSLLWTKTRAGWKLLLFQATRQR